MTSFKIILTSWIGVISASVISIFTGHVDAGVSLIGIVVIGFAGILVILFSYHNILNSVRNKLETW